MAKERGSRSRRSQSRSGSYEEAVEVNGGGRYIVKARKEDIKFSKYLCYIEA